jgi:ribokinase
MSRVVVLGDVNLDVIAQFPEYPPQGKDAFATSAEVHCGGAAANVAMGLARLGINSLLVARVGADAVASTALDSLAAAGVNLSAIQHDPKAMTGLMYVVVLPDGERTILGHRGANAHTDPGAIPIEGLQSAQMLHVSGYALLAEPQRSAALLALRLARQQGITVALDPGMSGHEAVKGMRSLLPDVHVLFPNLAEAQRLTGRSTAEDCARVLLNDGVQVVALKLGRTGCLVCSEDTCRHIPGFAVKARDTTGAGDGFDAGFVTGLLRGLDLAGAALLGNALGALISTALGANPSHLTVDTVVGLLRTVHDDPAFQSCRASIDGVIEALRHVNDRSKEVPLG